jgi:hypothetical protein
MQDASLQESMGPIVDRTKENLVSTDNGIIMARHRLLRALKAMEKGETPPGVDPSTRRCARPRWCCRPTGRSRTRRRSAAPRQGESFAGWLSDLAGRTKDLIDEVNSADLVVMIAQAGESAQAASIIGEACSVKRVMTTALVLGGAGVSDEALSKTLSHLRPWSLMLVIASAEDYIADMLTALRA